MTRTSYDQNESAQLIDCTAIGLCLIGSESEGLTKIQAKPAPEAE